MPNHITDRKIRIAILGCGRISKSHFDAIKAHGDHLELVAVCDGNPDSLARVQESWDVQAYTELDDMLANSDADVVTICTPSGLHARQAIKIANSGRHVISEKPMATRWQDGMDMVKAADDAGVRLFVVKQNRHNTTMQLLKRATEANRFGRIFMVNLNVFWDRPQSYYDQAKWRGKWEFDGGAFMNQASHYFDMLTWLMGPVQSVHAFTGTLARKIEAEDTGVVNVRWRSGALGSVNVTNLTYGGNYEGSITIIGEKGTVRVGGIALNEVQTWQFADEHPMDADVEKASYSTDSVYGFGHLAYYDNVVEVLRGNAEPGTDGRSGLKSLELLIAAYRSARDGTPVSLPLVY